MKILFQNLSSEQRSTYTLVLSAMDIYFLALENETGWLILVQDEDYEQARHQIEQYLAETEADTPAPQPDNGGYPATASGLWAALLLMLWQIHISADGGLSEVVRKYGASAAKILNGEFYRTVTALVIHADPVHLAANMVGLALFGTAVCSLTGWGMAWFLILITGIVGNYLTAVFYQALHTAVGASTSIFGAMGILCGHQFITKIRIPGQRFKALLPLGGGMALLSFIGSGERADIVAHLLGFLAGIGIGILYAFWDSKPADKSLQVACFLVAIIILTMAWSRPFVYA